MTIVIVQCRLSSTRLSEKAIKDLGGKPILEWTLNAMRKVSADEYYVATDEASAASLLPIVEKCKWKLFIGPLEDVLLRFCMLIKKTNADIVIRATADNPFLFYEAAQSLLDEYKRRISFSKCDYITWQGLPHGSGVEIFSGKSLLEAESYTDDPYDSEHVGPALYNHRNRFSSFFLTSPARFYYPDYRTTIDTVQDFSRARRIVQYLSNGNAPPEPYTTEQIISAFETSCVAHPVLLIPSTKKGRGTGHLHRCLEIASSIGSSVYVDELRDDILSLASHTPGFASWQLSCEMAKEDEYSLIVADCFSLSKNQAESLYELSPLVAIDEGSVFTNYVDYLIDIIPSLELGRKANCTNSGFMTLPVSVREKRCEKISDIKNVLVCLGGEDPSNLTVPASIAFSGEGREITAIAKVQNAQAQVASAITYIPYVSQLREKLSSCDLVVTHYGLTAYEAAFAGCAVILLATSELHLKLARMYGFVCLEQNKITKENATSLMENVKSLYPKVLQNVEKKHLGDFISKLAKGKRFSCPVCKSMSANSSVIARTEKRTFRRCKDCGIIYISYSVDGQNQKYEKEYFFSEYKNQYGKTYLEDFSSIENQGLRRVQNIQKVYKLKSKQKTLLDIGCAYGPFLSAASKKAWQVFGTDISEDAVSYVQSKLLFPASCLSFPNFDSGAEFGIQNFDAVTMWYVIEHFSDLDSVLKKISSLVKVGGVFAFSTPSAEGVSAKYTRQEFFKNSPSDHYTIWEVKSSKNIL
ncbi:MAG: methyltransferase domain-containing protein, partial [Treponema sp.]|nr:methyltransferase domain-containing protein [Treponema sp.]